MIPFSLVRVMATKGLSTSQDKLSGVVWGNSHNFYVVRAIPDHHFVFVDRWKFCVKLWKWNEGHTNARFFAAFLSLLGSFAFFAHLHWPRTWHRLCIVWLFQTRLVFEKTGRFFLHFFIYKEMSSFFLQKLKVVPTTLYTCFAPQWWVPNYHIIDKNIL